MGVCTWATKMHCTYLPRWYVIRTALFALRTAWGRGRCCISARTSWCFRSGPLHCLASSIPRFFFSFQLDPTS